MFFWKKHKCFFRIASLTGVARQKPWWLHTKQLCYIQANHHSHLIVTPSPPDPHLLRPTLQASYHRVLRDLWGKGDDPHCRVGVLEEGSYTIARRLLRGRMIGEITQFQAPKVLKAIPHLRTQMNPVPQNCTFLIHYGLCSRLQDYHHSADWADDPSYPDSRLRLLGGPPL